MSTYFWLGTKIYQSRPMKAEVLNIKDKNNLVTLYFSHLERKRKREKNFR